MYNNLMKVRLVPWHIFSLGVDFSFSLAGQHFDLLFMYKRDDSYRRMQSKPLSKADGINLMWNRLPTWMWCDREMGKMGHSGSIKTLKKKIWTQHVRQKAKKSLYFFRSVCFCVFKSGQGSLCAWLQYNSAAAVISCLNHQKKQSDIMMCNEPIRKIKDTPKWFWVSH